MLFSLVKRERLWYTMTMKALLSATVMFLSLACLPGCRTVPTKLDPPEEDAPAGVLFSLLTQEGEVEEQTFYEVCDSEHAAAFVQAHAVSEEIVWGLLDVFETTIYPSLPLETEKIFVLLLYMDGQTYGYTPLPVTDQGLIVCLNALYPDDLGYALAHEYQHLYAYYACEAGRTTLSEETDELLSDIFCELLFPDHGILPEARMLAAREKIDAWSGNALPHVYDLMRAGYGEDEWLNAMENKG